MFLHEANASYPSKMNNIILLYTNNIMINSLHLISLSFFVGFIGDVLLQFGSKQLHWGGSTGWGLKSYFSQHGSVESLFIAGGMMIFFYMIYFYLIALPFYYLYLAIYGIVLDFIFRKTRIFTSLDGYYDYFNHFWSAIWGAIPLMLPLFVYQIMSFYFEATLK